VVLLGGETGLRRVEITALEWGDIDLKKHNVPQPGSRMRASDFSIVRRFGRARRDGRWRRGKRSR